MLKVGIIGLGFMGRGHVDVYRRLEREGAPVRLVAVCDVDPGKLDGRDIISGNIDVGNAVDLSVYHRYTDYNEMLEKEDLDYVDIALPTFLHSEAARTALASGRHVLSEKPMAPSVQQCDDMVAASKKAGKLLMIAQCLRFWPAFEYLKDCVDTGRFGPVTSAYFFRGGSTPKWSWSNWLLQEDLGGGCLLDQHVHDVDTINWLFGLPRAVTTSTVRLNPQSGSDAVSTRYLYDDKVVCAEDDWTIGGAFGFEMRFRVNCQRGSLHFEKGKLTVYPEEGEGFTPELSRDDGYYREVCYFIDCIHNGKQPDRCLPQSTRETIRLVAAERLSAQSGGTIVPLD